MALISQSIPTLLRGVSQASDSTKQSDHAEIQTNATSSVTQGLKKRSGLIYQASLTTAAIGGHHMTTINKSEAERYVATFGRSNANNGTASVYDLTGTAQTLHATTGALSYINTATPLTDLRTISIADYTFVVNKTKTVAMNTAVTSGAGTAAIVFINQVSDKTSYTITVNSTTATHDTSSDNPLSTSVVAGTLMNKLLGQNSQSPTSGSALSGFTISQNGPVLWIRKNDNSDFTIDSNDTQGNSQITLVKNSVQRFSELPTVAPNNFVVEIKGDRTSSFDNYYVKFVTNNNQSFEEGQWEETVKTGITYQIDPSTMPHLLLKQTDNSWRLQAADGSSYTSNSVTYTLPKWSERTVGDLDSAPNPSFVDKKINNIFFFRNRLGFLADDDVIMSRVSEFFNFFPETATTIIDSDPIDVAASHTKISILNYAVSMGEQLILFSEQTQFVLTASDDALTPKTANIIVATEFESNVDITPVSAGSSIYYATKKGNFTGVREYISQPGVAIKDASDITIHIPEYITSSVYKMAVSSNEDVLVLVGSAEPNTLYINKWLYGDNFKKVLNSWSKFTFNSGRTIRNIDFVGTDLYIVFDETNGATLEILPFEPDFVDQNADFEYCLDHKMIESKSGLSITYSTSTGKTTWTLPYRLRAKMTIVGRSLSSTETSTYATSTGVTRNLKTGEIIQTTNSTDGSTATITADGDYRNSKVIIGESYEMQFRLSKQRLASNDNKGDILGGRLQLRNFYFKYQDTGFFTVEVTPEDRDTSTYKFTGDILGTSASTIGVLNLDTGTFKTPIMSRADKVNIDIKNNTYLPCKLTGAEYEAMFHMRSRRI